EAKIDFRKSAEEVRNHIRAMALGPGSSLTFGDKVIKVTRAELVGKDGKPGVVVDVSANDFVVACGRGSVRFDELQPSSRPKMSAREFLLGYKMKVGDKVEDAL